MIQRTIKVRDHRVVQWFTQFHSELPDFKIAVEHMVSDDDNAAFAYTITGTQDGPFNGIPATGKRSRFAACRFLKFDPDAKIVERWGASHEVGICSKSER